MRAVQPVSSVLSRQTRPPKPFLSSIPEEELMRPIASTTICSSLGRFSFER